MIVPPFLHVQGLKVDVAEESFSFSEEEIGTPGMVTTEMKRS